LSQQDATISVAQQCGTANVARLWAGLWLVKPVVHHAADARADSLLASCSGFDNMVAQWLGQS